MLILLLQLCRSMAMEMQEESWVTDDTQDELLSFEEFRARTGYSPQKVRSALMALQLSPVTRPGDMRRLFYLGSWVRPIQDFLAANGARRLQEAP
jgi:hypothetical protein